MPSGGWGGRGMPQMPKRPRVPVSAAEAARDCSVTPQTIRNWCRRHRIGRRWAGRWVVSAVAAQMIASGASPEEARRHA
jgi:hypothetical protein